MKKVLSVSLSVIEADNRVIRQCEAFASAGFEVHSFGLTPEEVRQTGLNFTPHHLAAKNYTAEVGKDSPKFSLLGLKRSLRLKHIAIKEHFLHHKNYLMLKIYLFLFNTLKLLASVPKLKRYLECKIDKPGSWEKIYWREPTFLDVYNKISNIDEKFDLVVANDWNMLPIARKYAKERNIPFVYDSHEHGISENAHSFTWNLLNKNFIFQLEKENLKDASYVTSVSEGIIESLKLQYNLACPTEVVRSTPNYKSAEFNPVNKENISLYFHGYLKDNRNLDQVVLSLSKLPNKYKLQFRGGHPSSKTFEKHLVNISSDINAKERFNIVPMAKHHELIGLANEADLGLIILDSDSTQFNMCLPNKFFEYVMAGLAIVASPMDEISTYIKRYDLGVITKGTSYTDIANAIKDLSVDDINNYKRNSLELAKQLNWEKEQLKLQNIAAELVK